MKDLSFECSSPFRLGDLGPASLLQKKAHNIKEDSDIYNDPTEILGTFILDDKKCRMNRFFRTVIRMKVLFH